MATADLPPSTAPGRCRAISYSVTSGDMKMNTKRERERQLDDVSRRIDKRESHSPDGRRALYPGGRLCDSALDAERERNALDKGRGAKQVIEKILFLLRTQGDDQQKRLYVQTPTEGGYCP